MAGIAPLPSESGWHCSNRISILTISRSTHTTHASSGGRNFSGDSFGTVDIAFIPFAYRINLLLGHYRDFSIPIMGELWQRYQQWYQSCIALPAFQATMTHDDEQLIEFYLVYSQGGGQAEVTVI